MRGPFSWCTYATLGQDELTHCDLIMMTSSNGNIFCVTGHLCWELTGDRWIPHTKASDAELWCFLWSARFDVFFDLCPNKLLSKQSCGWWSEMPSCSLWHHCNGYHIISWILSNIGSDNGLLPDNTRPFPKPINYRLLSFGLSGTNFTCSTKVSSKYENFWKKIHLKMLSPKFQRLCSGLSPSKNICQWLGTRLQ